MRRLVPPFILEQFSAGVDRGSFQAVCMFVDTSGFTPLTMALMAHGSEGAEAIAAALSVIYRPLVEAVYRYGGFITGYAGDAFKAVFPLEPGNSSAYVRAGAAAAAIHRHLQLNREVETRFGRFPFEVKVILADGEVAWGTWTGQGAGLGAAGQHAAYYFEGEGLARCLDADPLAGAGELVLTRAVGEQMVAAGWEIGPERDGMVRPLDIRSFEGPEAEPPGSADEDFLEGAAAFYPPRLLEAVHQGEFRQVVSVFVNFKRLPGPEEGDDPGRVLFRLLGQYGGYLCRIGRIGDRDKGMTLLLFWGAPAGHENDLANALQFLLDLRASLAAPFGAGVTYSMVYAGFIGAASREEYTCYGGGVNLAARLMVTAPPGEIWLDAGAARSAGAYALRELGDREFKGFVEPQPVYALSGRKAAGASTRFLGEMVGRRAELQAVLDAAGPVLVGRNAGVVTISGDAGIGKSRLVHAFLNAESMRAHQVRTATCRADEILRTPLHPVRYWLQARFGQDSMRPHAENMSEFRHRFAALQARMPDTAAGEGARSELVRLEPTLEALLGFVDPESSYARLDPKSRLENLFDAVKALVKAESLLGPFVVHLEDAHWADADTLQLMTVLTRNVADFPFAVIVTQRSGGRAPEIALAPGTPHLEIALAPFDREQLGELCRGMLGGPPGPALLDLLEARSDGNPFFAEQVLFYLLEHDGVAIRSGQFEPVIDRQVLPVDVRALLVARIDRLSEEVRRTVQTAAVLGREFEVTILAHMLRNEDRIGGELAAGEEARIWNAISELRYLFRHALLREASYEMQLNAIRVGLHRLAAEAYETIFADDPAPHYGRLAYHYRSAGEPEQAVGYFRRAADEAEENFQVTSAEYYLHELIDTVNLLRENGAAIPALDEPLLDALLRAGKWGNTMGNLVLAEQFFEQAIALARETGDAEGEKTARVDRAWAIMYARSFEVAIAYLEEILDELDPETDQAHRFTALSGLAQAEMNHGQLAAAERHYLEAIALAETLGDPRRTSTVLGNIGLVYWKMGDFERALSFYSQALEIDQAHGNLLGITRHTGNIGIVYMELGRYQEALDTIGESLEAALEMGSKRSIAMRTGNMGIVFGLVGRYEDAYRHFERALGIDREAGYRLGEGLWYGNIAEVLSSEERFEGALAQYDAAEAVLREIGATYNLPWVLVGKAGALLEIGDLEAAEAVCREAAGLSGKVGRKEKVFAAGVLAARIRAARGEAEAGREMLLGLFGEGLSEAEQAELHYELWRLGGEDHRAQARALYARAAEKDPQVRNLKRVEEVTVTGGSDSHRGE